ncbi:carbon starvation protein CstA [Denitrovibrio acetiphilus DSM 12809]|uniref:Carbon starvation protein CstA n=1 Tax=Denitrovibrio acetiphilus (strain DSM 12809 / NBRC 114555 / N2460) TaxID=522772 RepID=D4H247_DENA2|nr:carbon starvation protein A [Denitrovibrio acetiphilus]ADD67024.1 carbon starvation protein CstA [Denitrovibrio acetiphilus DSM 12809]
MIIFFTSVALLVAGYFVYGAVVDRIFEPDETRPTPAVTHTDGVDFVEMKEWKIYLVQLLNIAGLGPIFGPILGALYGPSALLWIVFGTIFGGAVHDYFSGMLSIRSEGKSIPDVVGYNLGYFFKQFMRVLSVVLLLLVGVVFVLGPAKLLTNMTGISVPILVGIIFAYYFVATILPIDKIIGKVYPIFGAVLIFMAAGLIIALIAKGYHFFPEKTLANINPQKLPLWPLMFITIACGAISGFHATQSPLMARCLPNEKMGRKVFYGAMVGEGIIALVWATLGLSFYQNVEGLNAALAIGGPAYVVNEISTTLLGGFGGLLAVVGVIILPISSGDTAFRSARLIIADMLNFDQKPHLKRLMICVPLFIVGFLITKSNFGVIWRYFGWANQTLAAVVLWSAAAYLIKLGKFHWIASVPATFMTAVTVTYLAYAKIGFGLDIQISTYIGIVAAVVAVIAFFVAFRKRVSTEEAESITA